MLLSPPAGRARADLPAAPPLAIPDATAAYYFKKHLERRQQEDACGQDVIEALRFLAGFFLKDKTDLVQAERYCEILLDYTGPEKREAEAMLREIRQLKAARGAI